MAKFLDLTGLGQFKTKIQEWAKGAFIPSTRKVNNKPLSADVTLGASDVGAIPTSQKGAANGVASLDGAGKVPAAQLPSYVDDVIEGYLSNGKFYKEEGHTTEIAGEPGKIYVDITGGKNKCYRWSGTGYAPTDSGIALGETASTAFPGDKGKAAYDHSLKTSGNPHNVTKSDVGLANVTNDKQMKGLASGTTEGHVMAFGADGYTPKDSGFTLQKSVPADAKFTDTTYGNFRGASSASAGGAGLVPAPAQGDEKKYLKADGTWGAPSFSIPDNYVTNEELEGKGYLTDDDLTAITTGEIDDLFK